jgi:hypothetical protein
MLRPLLRVPFRNATHKKLGFVAPFVAGATPTISIVYSLAIAPYIAGAT